MPLVLTFFYQLIINKENFFYKKKIKIKNSWLKFNAVGFYIFLSFNNQQGNFFIKNKKKNPV